MSYGGAVWAPIPGSLAPSGVEDGREVSGVSSADPAIDCAVALKIPIINRKGGVAKTTTTLNLGAAFAQARQLGIARRDFRTLVVDMDPQGSTTLALSATTSAQPHVGDVLLRRLSADEAVRATLTPNLHLIAAYEGFGQDEEVMRLGRIDRMRTLLRDGLTGMDAPFDFVLFDCPPSLGLPLALAMIAGDRFLIPTRLERPAQHGPTRLCRYLDELIALRQASPEPMASILGILLVDVSYQLNDAAESEAGMRADYGDAVLDTVIRRTVAIDRANHAFHTIFQHDPSLASPGAQCYRDLAGEVLLRGTQLGYVDPTDLSEGLRLRGDRLHILSSSCPG